MPLDPGQNGGAAKSGEPAWVQEERLQPLPALAALRPMTLWAGEHVDLACTDGRPTAATVVACKTQREAQGTWTDECCVRRAYDGKHLTVQRCELDERWTRDSRRLVPGGMAQLSIRCERPGTEPVELLERRLSQRHRRYTPEWLVHRESGERVWVLELQLRPVLATTTVEVTNISEVCAGLSFLLAALCVRALCACRR